MNNNIASFGIHARLLEVRENIGRRSFKNLFFQYATKVPSRLRKGIEYGFLISAFVSLLTLSYLHVVFIQRPISCLESVEDSWFRDGILRVEIIDSTQPSSQHSQHITERKDDLQELGRETNKFESEGEYLNLPVDSSTSNLSQVIHSNSLGGYQSFLDENISHFQMLARIVWPQEQHIVEYSLEYGFLRLTPKTRQKLNIPIKTIILDPSRDECFGDGVGRFLLKNFLGYDVILMGSLQTLAERQNSKGYFRNVVTGEHYRFVHIWMTRSAYFVALFIMLALTLFNSMLLRYAHHLIFVFVAELTHMLEFNINFTFPFAPLAMVILALVAMQAVMSEFFSDTSTAFNVMLIVWAADQFDNYCCQTIVSRRHWPRFFYLYHFLFYAYDYRFYGHYSSLALLTSWLFIQHSMVYFLHRYEIPYVLSEMSRNRETNGNSPPSLISPTTTENSLTINRYNQNSRTDSTPDVESSAFNFNSQLISEARRGSQSSDDDWDQPLDSEDLANNGLFLRLSHIS